MDKIFNQLLYKNIRMSLRRNLSTPEKLLWQKIRFRPFYGFLIEYNLSFGFIVIGLFIIIGSYIFKINDDHVVAN